jgi:predicted anti-sigma-YlaC factor YlaD
MHEPFKDSIIEDYLEGKRQPSVEAHLRECASCRAEVEAMKQHSLILQALRAPQEVEPSAGFYARVMNRIETQAKPSIWSIFGESIFAKRLAYASLSLVVLLGTYFVSSSENEEPVVASTPESMMVGDTQQVQVDAKSDSERNREAVLVNLATYRE